MKFRKTLFVLAGTTAMLLAACAGGGSDGITVCLASEPDKLDPALNSAVDGATLNVHLNSGLYRYVQNADKTALELVYDLAESITKTPATVTDHEYNETTEAWEAKEVTTGTRYTVKLRSGLKWSNGDDLDADDFIYSWNRASGKTLAADYGYMFDVMADYQYHASDDTACPSLAIRKVDDTSFTFDVVNDVPYMDQLLAFPTYFPVNENVVKNNENWATEAATWVSSGAYKMAEWEHNSYIKLVKNENYWNKDKITLNSITFALSDDSSAMLASYKAGEYDLIDDVPVESISQLKKDYPNEFVVAGQMGTYYVSFNINKDTFNAKADTEAKRQTVRRALALLINRQYIIDNVAQGGQVSANAFVSKGLADPAGGEFVDHNGPNGDGAGYYRKGETTAEYEANVADAINLLKGVGYTYDETTKKFTDFPSFEYLYNTSDGHRAIGENIRDTLKNYGIDLRLTNQEWNTFLNTRKEGNYVVARNGWVADYDDPSSYLTMWTTNSGNNDCQLGKGAHANVAIYEADLNNDGTISDDEKNLTWAQSYDVLVAKAGAESNPTTRFKYMHNAETLLMSTGCICPIYYYTDLYMVKSNISGFFSSPLGYKFFMYCTKA